MLSKMLSLISVFHKCSHVFLNTLNCIVSLLAMLPFLWFFLLTAMLSILKIKNIIVELVGLLLYIFNKAYPPVESRKIKKGSISPLQTQIRHNSEIQRLSEICDKMLILRVKTWVVA